MKNDYLALKGVLACPYCHSNLNFAQESIECSSCKRTYPVENGIPHFAVFSRENGETSKKPTSYYEQRYKDIQKARSYNQKYDQQFLKRMSTRREFSLIQQLLGTQPHCQTLLEVPCGGGRLSSQLVSATDMLIQADIASGQIEYLLQTNPLTLQNIQHASMTASAFQMPFHDARIDGLVCIRLSHHVSTVAQREALLEELLRVAKRFVIMTFFDQNSLKNKVRRFRGKRQKFTLSVSQVQAVAERNGASLAACPWLSPIGSGHRYALFVKD